MNTLAPGPRLARAHERDRGLDVAVRSAQQSFQDAVLVLGDERQVLGRDPPRELEARRLGDELAELQLHAFADRARADAGRIELLHELDEHLLDVFDRHENVRRQRCADRLEIVGQVAVVVDRVDDRLADRRRARVEVLELELPEQMIAQRLLGAVRVLDGRARIGALRRLGRPRLLRVLPVRFRRDGDLGLGAPGRSRRRRSPRGRRTRTKPTPPDRPRAWPPAPRPRA